MTTASHPEAFSSHFANPDELLTTEEAARELRLKRTTLEHKRMRGDGPPFVKLGRKVFYRRSALVGWVNAQERTSTAPMPPKPKARR